MKNDLTNIENSHIPSYTHHNTYIGVLEMSWCNYQSSKFENNKSLRHEVSLLAYSDTALSTRLPKLGFFTNIAKQGKPSRPARPVSWTKDSRTEGRP